MQMKQLLKNGENRLAEAGVEEASQDAWLLYSWLKSVNRTWYFLHMNDEADAEDEKAYERLISQRCQRKPVQYITGEQIFMGLPFQVNPSVLIPRQDTEVLVEECLKRLAPGANVLDMCTGSGCILISLIHYGEGIRGTGADISEEALKTAAGNAEANRVQASFVHTNLFGQIEGMYDMIVSNPPYIQSAVIETLMPEVREHEPILALDGTEDGLYFYREIVDKSRNYLNEGGWLCFEIGYDQGADVRAMMEEQGFDEIEVMKDLAGLDRVVTGKYRRIRNV